jgi:hypothetical protein
LDDSIDRFGRVGLHVRRPLSRNALEFRDLGGGAVPSASLRRNVIMSTIDPTVMGSPPPNW